jgi:hypothetical protein
MAELSTHHLHKADAALAQSIQRIQAQDALSDTPLRVILTLAATDDADNRLQKDDPSNYSSRRAYRSAMIANRKAAIDDAFSTVRERLGALSLVIKGGKVSRVVICEGSAADIVIALEDPGVVKATLDQPLDTR